MYCVEQYMNNTAGMNSEAKLAIRWIEIVILNSRLVETLRELLLPACHCVILIATHAPAATTQECLWEQME